MEDRYVEDFIDVLSQLGSLKGENVNNINKIENKKPPVMKLEDKKDFLYLQNIYNTTQRQSNVSYPSNKLERK